MLDHIYRIWCIPEKRMIKSDWEYTKLQMNYLKNDEAGNDDRIGFLKNYDGKVFELQLYSSKKDMHGETVCDGDIIYCQELKDSCKIVFNGCTFNVVMRDDTVYMPLEYLSSDDIVIMGNIYEGMSK